MAVAVPVPGAFQRAEPNHSCAFPLAPRGTLRYVTFDQLQQLGLVSRRGPEPKAAVMQLANDIARFRVTQTEHKVRWLAIRYGCSAGGGHQSRAKR